jgi:methyltransferase (TIGR00027 family)
LFKDPNALIFAGETGMKKVRPDMTKLIAESKPDSHSHIAIRARAFDDILEEEIRNESDEHSKVQVLNFGAGMCTRAWRIHCSNPISWYEIDQPCSIKLRQKIVGRHSLQPISDEYNMVEADFTQPLSTIRRQLKKQGFDPSASTVVIMEGLLMYLTYSEIQELAMELKELIDGPACLILSALNEGFLRELQYPGPEREREFPGSAHVKGLFTSSWEGGTKTAFEEAGWSVDFVMARELYAHTFLQCDMLNYPFPNRRTGTELFVVLRRKRVDSFKTILEDLLGITLPSMVCQP